MLNSPKFEVTIQGTHSLVIPDVIATPFYNARHSRVAVTAFYEENSILFHAKLHVYKEQFILSFGKRYQKQLGVQKGDFFTLQLAEDTTKYGVEMPEEFSAVLESDPYALEKFEALTDGKKRSLIYHIIRIKDSQTRIDRALLISENLKMNCTDLKLLTKYIR